MRYMLDTNICVALIRGRNAGVLDKLRRHSPDDICISSVTFAELEYGVAKSSDPPRNAALLVSFVAPIEVAPFDAAAASHYGAIRATLERAGQPIGPLDTLIAAHAMSIDAILVISNQREFSRVAGLRLDDWVS